MRNELFGRILPQVLCKNIRARPDAPFTKGKHSGSTWNMPGWLAAVIFPLSVLSNN